MESLQKRGHNMEWLALNSDFQLIFPLKVYVTYIESVHLDLDAIVLQFIHVGTISILLDILPEVPAVLLRVLPEVLSDVVLDPVLDDGRVLRVLGNAEAVNEGHDQVGRAWRTVRRPGRWLGQPGPG